MGKKVLKRSLVLGALMAFVITGNAWAEEPLTSPWNKGELESAIEIGNGTAKAFIEDSESNSGPAGPNAAYIVTGNDGIVTGNIDLTATYNPSVAPKGEVAAVLLQGVSESERAQITLIGDVTSTIDGCSCDINHCVFVNEFAHYTQKQGHINMSVNEAHLLVEEVLLLFV